VDSRAAERCIITKLSERRIILETNLKDFIPIIGALSGVLIGGFIAIFILLVNYKMNQRTERRNRKLKKLEEAYETLHLLDNAYSKKTTNMCQHMLYGEEIKYAFNSEDEIKRKINTVIYFYFPEFTNDLEDIYKDWIEVYQMKDEILDSVGEKEDTGMKKNLEEIVSSREIVHEKCMNLLRKIGDLSKQL
jgi:hypothetical protein